MVNTELGPGEGAPVVQRVSIPALQAAVLAADVRRASSPALQAAVLAVIVHKIPTKVPQEVPLALVVPVGLITLALAPLLPIPADHVLPVNTDLGPGEVAVIAHQIHTRAAQEVHLALIAPVELTLVPAPLLPVPVYHALLVNTDLQVAEVAVDVRKTHTRAAQDLQAALLAPQEHIPALELLLACHVLLASTVLQVEVVVLFVRKILTVARYVCFHM